MIHFFRRIRQKLLSENRLTRYLLYAIGEIVLVMIGILLALQINNWNESRKQKKLERSILSEMKENLLNDQSDIHRNLAFDSTNYEATLRVLNHLEGKEPLTEELRENYGKIGWGSLFAENTSAYENLKSLGFNLISNQQLREKITFLYSVRYEYLNEILIKYNDTLLDNFHPLMMKHTSTTTGDYFNRAPNDFVALSNNLHFQELLREDLFTKNFCILLNGKVYNEVTELIGLIDQELLK